MDDIVKYIVKFVPWTLLAVVFLVALGMWGCPRYNVWHNEMEGHAEYAKAESTRKVKVLEAQATKDAASLLGEAEVARAKGVAEANLIIGSSLKENEAYLRYLWIQNIEKAPNVIYVPTEAGLPILEANRLKK